MYRMLVFYILRMRYQQGMSQKDIAEVLQVARSVKRIVK